MRIAVLLATSVLVAGCSQAVDGEAERAEPILGVSPSTTRALAPETTTTSTASRAPAAGSPIRAVITWVEAASPADTDGFHIATRDGETTPLGDDIAFTTSTGTPSCMTDSRSDGALACLVDLRDPPARPDDVYGEWKGGWVDFPGPSLEIGSAHGDPGRFGRGDGAPLPMGQSLSFGDYRCRTDSAAVLCVNYAHQSAARFSADGIDTFGCLQPTTAPDGIGAKFSC